MDDVRTKYLDGSWAEIIANQAQEAASGNAACVAESAASQFGTILFAVPQTLVREGELG
jgi:hypothetical protein